jgi:quinoprotein glucose dehydrogenase
MIDPIWEYNHIIGKSITGGVVYRGKQVPQLVGKYLYGDYVGKQIWALDYDAEAKKVVANYRIDGGENPPLDIVSFGEDQSGEVYLLVSLGQIFKFKSNE